MSRSGGRSEHKDRRIMHYENELDRTGHRVDGNLLGHCILVLENVFGNYYTSDLIFTCCGFDSAGRTRTETETEIEIPGNTIAKHVIAGILVVRCRGREIVVS